MLRATLLAVLLGTALTACQTSPWGRTSGDAPPVELLDDDKGVVAEPLPDPGLPLSAEQRFKDVPLPQDAHEDLERTYVYESGTLQIGRMVYTSKASINELAQFYIRECPAAEWKLERALQAGGAELLFRKPGKRLDVEIRSQGVGRSQLLVLNLTPDP